MSSDKLGDLRSLYADWAGCERCELCAKRRNTVFADGSPGGPLMILSDKPGYHEDKSGIPLVGPAGKLLGELILAATGRDADAAIADGAHVTAAVMCRPPADRSPTPLELKQCWPRLREQIRIVDPWLILALGATAFGVLVAGGRVPMPKVKKVKGVPKVKPPPALGFMPQRGEVVDVPIWFPNYGMRSIAVLPTYHPNFLLQRPDLNEGGELYRARNDVNTAFKVMDDLRSTYAK